MSDCKPESKGGKSAGNGGGKGGSGNGAGNGGRGQGDGAPTSEKEHGGSSHQLKTAPVDPRFPNTNQTNYCYSMYCDYFRCQCLLGEEYEACSYFKNVYTRICPMAWVEKWDDQRERGVFVGRIHPNI